MRATAATTSLIEWSGVYGGQPNGRSPKRWDRTTKEVSNGYIEWHRPADTSQQERHLFFDLLPCNCQPKSKWPQVMAQP